MAQDRVAVGAGRKIAHLIALSRRGILLMQIAVARWAIKIPQSMVDYGLNFGAPEGTRTPASGSGGLRDIHFTTGAH